MFLNKILKLGLFSFLLVVTVFLSAQEPVVLTSFTAEFGNGVITLYWRTESEVNNSHWNIYRAEENTLDYAIKINEIHISGSGTTSEPTEYQYEDNYELDYGVNYYYWLESVDFALQGTYFGPISIEFGLPVTFDYSSFQATFGNETLTIFWATQSETNNSHWNIYRAEEDSFEAAEKLNASGIQGAGTTNEFTEYWYVDNSEITYDVTYYYWLECVDFAGQSHYFGSISIYVEVEDIVVPSSVTALIGAEPNPTDGLSRIRYLVKDGDTALLTIKNMKNQTLESAYLSQTPAIGQTYQWDCTDLEGNDVTSGIYKCTLESASYFGEIELVIVNFSGSYEFTIGNYPNPFNPETSIFFYANEPGKVEITIYNEKGQKVKTLANGFYGVGQHSELWEGTDDSGKPVSGGIYFYQVKKNGKVDAVKKCLLLK